MIVKYSKPFFKSLSLDVSCQILTNFKREKVAWWLILWQHVDGRVTICRKHQELMDLFLILASGFCNTRRNVNVELLLLTRHCHGLLIVPDVNPQQDDQTASFVRTILSQGLSTGFSGAFNCISSSSTMTKRFQWKKVHVKWILIYQSNPALLCHCSDVTELMCPMSQMDAHCVTSSFEWNVVSFSMCVIS